MASVVHAQDCLTQRRKLLRQSSNVFGLDFVEVCSRRDHDTQHRKFRLHFLGLRPEWLKLGEQIKLLDCRSGRRMPVSVVAAQGKQNPEHGIEVEVLATVCDDVEYTLTLESPDNAVPSLDPFFACITFRFDSHAPAKVDCVPSNTAKAPTVTSPDINYLAKDYATFRQLILDRLAVTMPDWQEHCPADIGVMLVEILAYSADHLSYYQDAVATEAYLGTARLRKSLRRHARLVDYRVHEGCNARAWVHLKVSEKSVAFHSRDLFFVSVPNQSSTASTSSLSKESLNEIIRKSPGCEVYEPVVSKAFTFWASHNDCRIHDWGGATPCLPKGATSAYLSNPDGATADERQLVKPTVDRKVIKHKPLTDKGLQFRKGDIVIFEEIIGPWTGNDADADPTHRHVVRLTDVDYEQRDDLHEEDGKPSRLPLVKISWGMEDALPFTLWITKPTDAEWTSTTNRPISVARGNVLLVDHGRSLRDEVNLSKTWEVPDGQSNAHYPAAKIKASLGSANLTFSAALPSSGAPASAQVNQDPRKATPQVLLQPSGRSRQILEQFTILELRDPRRIAKRLFAQLEVDPVAAQHSTLPKSTMYAAHVQRSCGCHGEPAATQFLGLTKLNETIRDDLCNVWLPLCDLIDCGPDDARFVVEMSDDRQAQLRFGQRGFGRTPDLEENPRLAEMVADYRVGNGIAGNVPAESIRMFGSFGPLIPGIEAVRNPLPAVGGVDPENPQQVRLFAPHAIRSELRRAITAEDYEHIAMREFGQLLQRAKATFLWTGHEYEVLLAVDPKGREVAAPNLLTKIRWALHRYRRIGHSVRVRGAERVVPTIKLSVCLNPHVIKGQIRSELDRLFSHQVLPDGTLGFFHPDQLTFGAGISVSKIIAAATRAVGDRIIHIEVTALHRTDEGPAYELENGFLPLRPQEIVRFDNDRNHPEFGTLQLEIKGGR